MTNGNDDYKVGYGRPPLNTRFEKGKSGNPKGRSKGRKNLKTLVEEEFFRPVEIREAHGRIRRVPLIQASLRGLGLRSIKETRAAMITFDLLDRIERKEVLEEANEMRELLAEDKEILARYSFTAKRDKREGEDDR